MLHILLFTFFSTVLFLYKESPYILICLRKSCFMPVFPVWWLIETLSLSKCPRWDNKLYGHWSSKFLFLIIYGHKIQTTFDFYSLHVCKPRKKLWPRKLSYMARPNSSVCEFLFSFLRSSTLRAGTFGKGPLCSARPRCGALGKTPCCLFCGEWQQSSLRRLKAKWKNTSGLIFPLPILTESMSECTVPKFKGNSGPSTWRQFSRHRIGRAAAQTTDHHLLFSSLPLGLAF